MMIVTPWGNIWDRTQEIRVSCEEFALHGLRFSVDRNRQHIRVSIGTHAVFVPFWRVPKSWISFAPFVAISCNAHASIETLFTQF